MRHSKSGRKCEIRAGVLPSVVAALCATVFVAEPAVANGDEIFLECPCEIARKGDTFRITAGLRNFLTQDTGPLHLGFAAKTLTTRAFVRVASIKISDNLAPGESMERATFEIPIDASAVPASPRELEIWVYQDYPDLFGRVEPVRMEFPVDLEGDFAVGDLDYVKDADGDGTGDIHERMQGTDSADPASTPEAPTIDVLALYSQGVPALYGNDPTTRIQHLFTLANAMLANSGADFRFRVVGMVPMQIDESPYFENEYARLQEPELRRHSADLVVWIQPKPQGIEICGYAHLIGALRYRGRFEFERESSNYAVAFADCAATVLPHELGHLMGLGHSYWQNSIGTWRWARGHWVENDFHTIMSYRPLTDGSLPLEVFSSPLKQCVGQSRQSKPCGVSRVEDAGADSVAALNAVRFQIAGFRDSHPDVDGDGFVDPADDLPLDPDEWYDTDSDGVGNNADTDDDGDGVPDSEDTFPLNGADWIDSDDDGVGDNTDAFPMNPAEFLDTDGDGVGNNADHFPDDPAEIIDTDGDRVGDNGDLWPEDPSEWYDTDGDGLGDNIDTDADNDGFNDDIDPYPLDADKTDLLSYRLIGEHPGDSAGEVLASGANGGQRYFAIGVPYHDSNGNENAGAVYLVSESDLMVLDMADGQMDRTIDLGTVTSGSDSWKFVGDQSLDQAGSNVDFGADFNGDGLADLLIGARYGSRVGTVYMVSGADFSGADAADGATDRTINLSLASTREGSWKLIGEARHDNVGSLVAPVPDSDGDGSSELLVSAWGHDPGNRSRAGAAYYLSSGDLAAIDAADGETDRVINLGNVSSQSASWKFIGEAEGDYAGYRVGSVGDYDGDDNPDIVISASYHRIDPTDGLGAAYLVSTGDFAAADVADGLADHVIELGHVAGQPKSWKLVNSSNSSLGSRSISFTDATDGFPGWLLIGNHLVSWELLAIADAEDGTPNGIVDMQWLILLPDSWYLTAAADSRFVGDVDGDGHRDVFARSQRVAYVFSPIVLRGADTGAPQGDSPDGVIYRHELERENRALRLVGSSFTDMTAAGDIDADGLSDVLIGGAIASIDEDGLGFVHLLFAADQFPLDRADGRSDRLAHMANFGGDTDGDGLPNSVDLDDDGDGYLDVVDTFQLDPNEWADRDLDGVPDNSDALPDNRGEWVDTDGDGLGDFREDDDDDGDGIADSDDRYPLDTDNDGVENDDDADDDGDGVLDSDDRFPVDATETMDTDYDGIGNNADNDDDGDGVADADDALPLDARDSVDTDGDGIGDTTDAFPGDAAETVDFDGDGIGDNADLDDDGDGVADVDDEFPFNAGASRDTDGDGVPDSQDRYPTHPGEWENTDGAGFGDNRDTDDDNDGVEDVDDFYPKDSSRWNLASSRMVLGIESEGWAPDLAAVGDLDGDGKQELAYVAPDADDYGEAYVISLADLTRADRADGIANGTTDIRNVLAQPGSWKLEAERGQLLAGVVHPLSDLDGDGIPEFFLSARWSPPAAYVVSGANLPGADAADGFMDSVVNLERMLAQPGSWKLYSDIRGGTPTAALPADLDGDGVDELVISQWSAAEGRGVVFAFSADMLSTIDALDGVVGGRLLFSKAAPHARWRFVGEWSYDMADIDMVTTDFDGDGQSDLVIGAPHHDANRRDEGALYLINSKDFESADLADGNQDQQIELGRVASQPNSWKIAGDVPYARLGRTVLDGDMDGDGRSDLMVVSRGTDTDRVLRILSGAPGNLAALDESDGATDGMIGLGSISSGANRRIADSQVLPYPDSLDLLDFDGDGLEDVLLGIGGSIWNKTKVAHLIASSSLFGHSGEFQRRDLTLDERFQMSGSYQIHAPEAVVSNTIVSVSSAGDLDNDGIDDIFLAVMPFASSPPPIPPSAVYMIMGAELPHLDAADGRRDGKVFLSNLVREHRSP